MTGYISDRLATYLCEYGLITIDEKSEYKYFSQVLIEKIIGFGAIILLAACNHLLLQTVFFLLFFSEIRKYSGGFHARNFFECLVISLVVYLGYVKFVFHFLLNKSWLNTCLLIVAVFIIFTIGAVNHPNMHWDKKEYIISKNTARMTCMIEIGIIIAFWLIGISYDFILFMSFGLILSALMLLIAKLIRQEVVTT